jgi:predicted transcriptional regulator
MEGTHLQLLFQLERKTTDKASQIFESTAALRYSAWALYGGDLYSIDGQEEMDAKQDLVEMAAEIVSAYVSANSVAAQDLPGLIRTVHAALKDVSGAVPASPETNQEPAVAIKKSVTPDYIVCLEDGKKFKSLKRHLRTRYGMTPDEYRAKWGLAHDYPMVAPNYAKERSNLAKRMKLGHARKAAE